MRVNACRRYSEIFLTWAAMRSVSVGEESPMAIRRPCISVDGRGRRAARRRSYKELRHHHPPLAKLTFGATIDLVPRRIHAEQLNPMADDLVDRAVEPTKPRGDESRAVLLVPFPVARPAHRARTAPATTRCHVNPPRARSGSTTARSRDGLRSATYGREVPGRPSGPTGEHERLT